MKKKLCMLLFGLCLASMSACGNRVASDSPDNITSKDEIDMTEDVNAESESEPEADQNELDLEELKLMVPDASEYFKQSGEVFSDSYVSFEGDAYCIFRVYDNWNDDEWNSYKQAVIDAGFSNVRFDTDESFSAWTEDGRFYFSFSIGEDQDRRCIYINASKDKDTQSNAQTLDEEESSNVFSEDTEDNATNADKELVDGVRPEFKEAIDSYEAFYDEYCDIIKKYTANPTDMELLTSYTDMLTRAAEMTEKFEAWENNEMNDAELKYYLDVNNRVTQKLLELYE